MTYVLTSLAMEDLRTILQLTPGDAPPAVLQEINIIKVILNVFLTNSVLRSHGMHI